MNAYGSATDSPSPRPSRDHRVLAVDEVAAAGNAGLATLCCGAAAGCSRPRLGPGAATAVHGQAQHAHLWPPTPFQPAELAAGRQQSMLCVRLCVGEEDGPRVAIREKAGGFVKTSDSCEQCRKGSMCSYLICVFRRGPDARFQFPCFLWFLQIWMLHFENPY